MNSIKNRMRKPSGRVWIDGVGLVNYDDKWVYILWAYIMGGLIGGSLLLGLVIYLIK